MNHNMPAISYLVWCFVHTTARLMAKNFIGKAKDEIADPYLVIYWIIVTVNTLAKACLSPEEKITYSCKYNFKNREKLY